MVNLLTPLNGSEYIQSQEGAFADIEAYLHRSRRRSIRFAIDEKLAARGRKLFADTCARCHGTEGPDGKYPNKIVPLETIGTDRTLAAGNDAELLTFLNQSWFGRELGPDGKPLQFAEPYGYQAPPLDGVWATAPYFHNGSVPTIYHVLNSKARPSVYTRSYRTGKEDYDAQAGLENHRAGQAVRFHEVRFRGPQDLRHNAARPQQRRTPLRRQVQ